MVNRIFIVVLSACVFLLSFVGKAQSKAKILPIEQTLAWELMELESTYVKDEPDKRKLLKKVLDEALAALGPDPKQPKTKDEVIKASEAMAQVFAKNNFLQPLREKDWPDTLGEAFTPKNLSPDELQVVLSYYRNDTPGVHNERRNFYTDKSKSIYYVDCDMSAILIISTAQRLGWDVRLIEVPKHNFVRWHLPNGEKVNWDWTRWGSEDDSEYARDYSFLPFFAASVRRGVYLRSFDFAEARAYYLIFVADLIQRDLMKKRELFHEALKAGSKLPIVQNNFAWFVATFPSSSVEEIKLALTLALTSWADDPLDANTADTVACVYSRISEKDLALDIEKFAINNSSGSQRDGFIANKNRISNDEICE